MKGTPGPWNLATTYQSNTIDIVPWATQRQRICRLKSRKDYRISQMVADACVIAAAPEMLEVLEELVEYAADYAFVNGEFQICITKANKVIRKAKGEAE
jgi:hypothetical protein